MPGLSEADRSDLPAQASPFPDRSTYRITPTHAERLTRPRQSNPGRATYPSKPCHPEPGDLPLLSAPSLATFPTATNHATRPAEPHTDRSTTQRLPSRSLSTHLSRTGPCDVSGQGVPSQPTCRTCTVLPARHVKPQQTAQNQATVPSSPSPSTAGDEPRRATTTRDGSRLDTGASTHFVWGRFFFSPKIPSKRGIRSQ